MLLDQLTQATQSCPTVDELSRFVNGRADSTMSGRILKHLDNCDACRILIAATIHTSSAPDDATLIGYVPRTLQANEIVNARYQLVRFVARGGMGEVYEAWDLQLNETVALKTIASTGLDDAKQYVRIRTEVQLARRVTHPNVCRILEFGLHHRTYRGQEETIPFFTMEFLSGESLADYLTRHGRLNVDQVMPIVSQILQGLSAIHKAGIIHRDLKPENVFLLAEASGGNRVLLMDFGLARRRDNLQSTGNSTDHVAVGTPSYMAPEQCMGASASVSWDIYALGVMFFKLATGEFPFKGSTSVAIAMARIQDSAPSLSSLVPGINPGFEAVVARCLQRDPARRFASVEELQCALCDISLGHASQGSHARTRHFIIVGLLLTGLGVWSARQLRHVRPLGLVPQPHATFASSSAVLLASASGHSPRSALLDSTSAYVPPNEAAPVRTSDATSSPSSVPNQEGAHRQVWKSKPAHEARKDSVSSLSAWSSPSNAGHITEFPNEDTSPTSEQNPAPFNEDDVVIPAFVGKRRRLMTSESQ